MRLHPRAPILDDYPLTWTVGGRVVGRPADSRPARYAGAASASSAGRLLLAAR